MKESIGGPQRKPGSESRRPGGLGIGVQGKFDLVQPSYQKLVVWLKTDHHKKMFRQRCTAGTCKANTIEKKDAHPR